MTNKPDSGKMISVIVATYNQESTIGRTLDSILAQRYDGPLEIIIGDDCSSDGTRKVCEQYARRHPDVVKYIRRDRNLGVSANYFDCLRQAKGVFIADCAGDDFWVDPDKLQRQHDFLIANPSVSLVATDWMCCDPDGCNVRRAEQREPVTAIEFYDSAEAMEKIFIGNLTPHLCSSLYRMEILKPVLENGNSLSMTDKEFICEDTQILLLYAKSGQIAVLPGVTLHYSVGHDSISHRQDIGERFDYELMNMRQSAILAKEFGLLENNKCHRWLTDRVDYVSALAFHSGSRERADALISLCKSLDLKGHWKASLYDMAMKKDWIWRLLAAIHR